MKKFTKRLLSVVLSVLIVMSVMPTAFASTAEPWSFSKTEVKAGEEFVMTMEMPEDVHASSLGFKVVFDNTVFEIIEIPTTQWSDMQPNMAGCNKNGNVMISWCDPTFDANTDIAAGTNLLTVKFVAKADAVLGESTFTCEDWNVLGAFSYETYDMEVITPMPEIMNSSKVVTVVEDAPAVAADPVIIDNPESVEILDGEVANLDVIAESTDGGEISYQWYKDGVAIEGAIAPDLAVSEAGTYYVVVTNTLGETTASVTSTEALVTVKAKADTPVIDTIDDVVIVAGESATLTANATANGTLSYEWYFGEEVISLEPSVTVSEAGIYKVVVTNTLNGTSASAEVTVNVVVEEPEIKEDADANNVLLGKEYTHNVATWHTANTAADNGFLTDGLYAGSWWDKSNVEYFAAKSQAVVEITFDMWYAREIKELAINFLEDSGSGIARPDYLEVYAINGTEETLIYDAKIPTANLRLVADEAVTAEKIKIVTTGGTYTFLDEVAAYVEATGETGYAMGETAPLVNHVAGMTYTIEGVTKWYNTKTDDSAATKLTDGVLSSGTGYNSVNNFGSQSSTAPVITFNFDEVKDIAEIDIYAIFGKDGIPAPPVVIEYKDANGNWVKVADIAALLHQNFIVAKETIKATALRFTFAKGFCFLGEIQVFDKVTNMAATAALVSNDNYLLGRTYTSDVTSWYKDAANDSASTYLTDGVKGGDFYGSAYFGAKQGTAEVIFALDEATKLSEIYMQFLAGTAGITIPATTIYVQASDDAEWVKIYDGTPAENNFRAGAAEGFTAKNIKLNFVGGPFIFVKEVEAYKELTGNATNGTLEVVPDAVAPTVVINDGKDVVISDDFRYMTLSAFASTTDEGVLSYEWYKDGVEVGCTEAFYTMMGGAAAGTYTVVVKNTLGTSTAAARASIVVTENEAWENLALGTSYEWISGMWAAYPDAGNELTDGELSTWAYYGNEAYAGAASPEIIFDLGSAQEIGRVAMLFMSTGNSGLAHPSVVKYQYSTDKDTWYDFGTEWKAVATNKSGYMIADANVAVPVEAQYIRMVATGSWIFLGEFMAYGEKTVIPAAAPVIDEDLAIAESIFAGETAELKVVASTTDEGVLSYQWYKDGVAIEGATDASLIVTEAGLYKVVVTNTLGETTATAESAICAVTVLEKANVPTVSDIPNEYIGIKGTEPFWYVIAEGNGDITIEWFFGGEKVGEGEIYNFDKDGVYTVVVTNTLNGTSEKVEENVSVTLFDPPTVPVVTVEDVTIKEGETATLTAVVENANGEVSYTWYKDGVVIGDTATINVTEAGEYKVVVENAVLNVNVEKAEATATVTVEAINYVAEANGVPYETLAEAIAVGGEVKLLDNITLAEKLVVEGTVTLDLAGYTVSQTYEQTTGYSMIENKGVLTINDSVGSGKLSYTDAGNGGEYISDTIYNRGVLVINGGTIENLSSSTVATNGYPHAVDTYSGDRNTSVTINGGTIYCENYSAIRMFCVSANNEADLVINDGTVIGAIDMQNGSKVAANGTLTINGGTFEKNVSRGNVRFANWNPGATEYGITASITDGNFDAGLVTTYVPAAANWDKQVVSGGTFGADVTEFCVEGYMAVEKDGVYEIVEAPSVPVITTEPEDATILEGEVAELAVVASANGELSYQWYKDGVAIEGATEATYAASEAGEYYAVVTNTLNGETATTETVKVTVTVEIPAPVFVAPELVFDAETRTLTLAKNDALSARVGIAYIGEATFDATCPDWDAFVALGKAYPNANGASGYVITSDFTAQSFKTVGNYVAFVKYTNGEGKTVSDYYVFSIGVDVEFTAPEFSFDEASRLLTLAKNDATSVKVGAAFIGDATFDAENGTWEEFVALGQAQSAANGSSGYAVYNDFVSRSFKTEGNYVAFAKYMDSYGTTCVEYFTFAIGAGIKTEYTLEIVDYKFTMTAPEGFAYRMGVAYIGNEEFDVTAGDWDDFIAKGKANANMNGSSGYVLYVNSCPTKTYRTPGNYAAFVKYLDSNGNTVVDYYVFTIRAFVAPELVFENNTLSVVMNEAESAKVGVAYIGDASFDAANADWSEFVALGKANANMNGANGYVTYNYTDDATVRAYRTLGNYVAFVKYTNTITGSTNSVYSTFTVA